MYGSRIYKVKEGWPWELQGWQNTDKESQTAFLWDCLGDTGESIRRSQMA